MKQPQSTPALFPVIPDWQSFGSIDVASHPAKDDAERNAQVIALMQKTLAEMDQAKLQKASEAMDKATKAFADSIAMQIEWFLGPYVHLALTHSLCYHPGSWRQEGSDNVFEQWVSLQPKVRFTGPSVAEMPDWDGPKCLLHFRFIGAFSRQQSCGMDAQSSSVDASPM